MKQGILGVLLASRENIVNRAGSFELYGADFMLSSSDFLPWLIEINVINLKSYRGERGKNQSGAKISHSGKVE
jgi:hypothetical protein